MLKRGLVILGGLVFAFGILVVSVLRTAEVKYSFSAISNADSGKQTAIQNENERLGDIFIDYYPAYPGTVIPGDFLWPLKAFRDKLWLGLTTDLYKKAELNLLFADKRLMASQILFERKKYELGYSTLTKAEKYLEAACDIEDILHDTKGQDTLDLATRIIKASLKHRQIIKQMMLTAPGDAVPKLLLTENYPRGIYGRKVHVLLSRGVNPPPDPFNGL